MVYVVCVSGRVCEFELRFKFIVCAKIEVDLGIFLEVFIVRVKRWRVWRMSLRGT